jgi:hypothetical protein
MSLPPLSMFSFSFYAWCATVDDNEDGDDLSEDSGYAENAELDWLFFSFFLYGCLVRELKIPHLLLFSSKEKTRGGQVH